LENCTNRYICLDEKGYPELYSSFQQIQERYRYEFQDQ
jgi:hypothetical protein